MADKLPHDEDGHFDVVGDGALLERAGVPVFVKIEEELLVLVDAFAGAFVGDAGGLDDAEIGAEVVDIADVPLAEDGDGVAFFHEERIEPSGPPVAEGKRGRGRLSCEKFELIAKADDFLARLAFDPPPFLHLFGRGLGGHLGVGQLGGLAATGGFGGRDFFLKAGGFLGLS